MKNTLFGVEIESYVPSSSYYNDVLKFKMGRYHERTTRADTGWWLETDSSIRGNGSYIGVESISPILFSENYKATYENICNHIKWLNIRKARMNNSCGIHVHVDISNLTLEEFSRFICMSYLFQPILYECGGYPTRSHSNYAKPVEFSKDSLLELTEYPQTVGRYLQYGHGFGLNCSGAYTKGPKTTVEFRHYSHQHNQEIDPNYILLCINSSLSLLDSGAKETSSTIYEKVEKFYKDEKMEDGFILSHKWDSKSPNGFLNNTKGIIETLQNNISVSKNNRDYKDMSLIYKRQ